MRGEKSGSYTVSLLGSRLSHDVVACCTVHARCIVTAFVKLTSTLTMSSVFVCYKSEGSRKKAEGGSPGPFLVRIVRLSGCIYGAAGEKRASNTTQHNTTNQPKNKQQRKKERNKRNKHTHTNTTEKKSQLYA